MTFTTINRWKNRYAMPFPLALKQIDTLLHRLCQSPEATLRARRQAIRNAGTTSWRDRSRRLALERARADYQALKETTERWHSLLDYWITSCPDCYD